MTPSILLGAVADDLTGATDLALMLARNGMKTVQFIGVPPEDADFGDAEAVVVALKSRTIAADDAIAMSLASALALRTAGAEQILFKYCSTFDSTDAGNIGPVAEALMDLLGVPIAVACPAFPAAGRSVYQGHLFVGASLLSDSPMRDHPLTPMRDANLVRVLQKQTAGRVGLIPLDIVEAGPDAIRALLIKARQAGFRLMIADAVRDADLRQLGEALSIAPLVTGGSGIAMGLPENFRKAGRIGAIDVPATMRAAKGRSVVLAGSCSMATRGQVQAAIDAGMPALRLIPADIAAGAQPIAEIANWVLANTARGPALVYSSDTPEAVQQVQQQMGSQEAGALIEHMLANLSVVLRDNGFNRFIVAGGETSGAVVAALGVTALQIGPEIAPGVPWTRSVGTPDLVLALKSGNFGAPDFFLKAWDLLHD
ncbi:MAG: four-carbon acid sugar kinase family protein [Alphaproteobacteria bacterium]|nr:four-carbon acid sugar kinase family protein [Alphaproteobacteria bacterium]